MNRSIRSNCCIQQRTTPAASVVHEYSSNPRCCCCCCVWSRTLRASDRLRGIYLMEVDKASETAHVVDLIHTDDGAADADYYHRKPNSNSAIQQPPPEEITEQHLPPQDAAAPPPTAQRMTEAASASFLPPPPPVLAAVDVEASGGPTDEGVSRLIVNNRWLGKRGQWWALMALSSGALVVGLSVATILGRLYFDKGGKRRWLYTWIESVGWPLLLPPLAALYRRRRRLKDETHAPINAAFGLRLAAIFAGMGCLTALDNLLYSWGTSYLPVSTNALLSASQLAFNAVFSAALVRQRLTAYSLNAIFVITAATLLLAFSSSGAADRPASTTAAEYGLGVAATVAASALFALLLPLTEMVYKRVVGKGTFARVLEVQAGVSGVASVVAAVGMAVAGDWKAIAGEAAEFGAGGAAGYAATLAACAAGWQLYLVGGAGVIFLASSLMSCVFMTAMIPLLPILAVVVFHDSFSALKALAMVLSLWGFLSYLYGAYLRHCSAKISDTPPAASSAIRSS